MKITTGRKIGSLGALLAILAFFMPWVSCGNLSLSGLDIALSGQRLSSSGVEGAESNFLLFLVPGMAIVILIIIYNHLEKSAKEARGSTIWQLICGAIGGGMAALWLLGIIIQKNDPKMLGLGIWIKIEPGIWATLVGYLGTIVGAWLDRKSED